MLDHIAAGGTFTKEGWNMSARGMKPRRLHIEDDAVIDAVLAGAHGMLALRGENHDVTALGGKNLVAGNIGNGAAEKNDQLIEAMIMEFVREAFHIVKHPPAGEEE